MNLRQEPGYTRLSSALPSTYAKLLTEVKLGDPRYGCSGTGICSIDLVSPLRKKRLSQSKKSCGYMLTECSLISWDILKMEISIESLCCLKCNQVLESGFLRIPAPVDIPMEICLYWNATSLKVKPGYYPVVKSRKSYSLKINLQRVL